eukprot:14163-Heterococcus_DN1.PRE.2
MAACCAELIAIISENQRGISTAKMPIPIALSAQGALGAHETTFRFRKKWSASDQACAFYTM